MFLDLISESFHMLWRIKLHKLFSDFIVKIFKLCGMTVILCFKTRSFSASCNDIVESKHHVVGGHWPMPATVAGGALQSWWQSNIFVILLYFLQPQFEKLTKNLLVLNCVIGLWVLNFEVINAWLGRWTLNLWQKWSVVVVRDKYLVIIIAYQERLHAGICLVLV